MDVMVKKLEDMEKKLTNSYKDSEKKVSKKLEDFEATLSFYGDKIDEATKSVKAMEQKLVLMENRLDKSERENKELKTRLRNMEIQMNEIAQKQYNNQMEISGVKDKNINAEIAVSKVLEKTGYKAALRIAKKNNNRPNRRNPELINVTDNKEVQRKIVSVDWEALTNIENPIELKQPSKKVDSVIGKKLDNCIVTTK
ncbi:hypothetical protein M8J76_011833 [Diaphorina citri]|nr:hypothetical protein M8J76_011833 [Diaphorina citri]